MRALTNQIADIFSPNDNKFYSILVSRTQGDLLHVEGGR